MTDEFVSSLYKEFVTDYSKADSVEINNIHIYGGPGVGKTTLARAIGYIIAMQYGLENTCCIEANFLPTAIEAIDPSKKVFVLHIDDPMAQQDARRPMSDNVTEAAKYFNEIRHIIARKIIRYKIKTYLSTDTLPDRIEKLIRLEAWSELREEFPDEVITAQAIVYTIFGPQTPEIDLRLHQSKLWNIFKGFGSMDEKRKEQIRRRLGEYMYLLGKYEKNWRSGNKDYQSYSILEDPFTNKKGIIIIKPKPFIFEKVERGEHHYVEQMKDISQIADRWSEFIYKNRKDMKPPYSVFYTQQMRFMALRNFIRDCIAKNKNPIENRELDPREQSFLKYIIKHISLLDDSIIKFYGMQNEKEKLEAIAENVIEELERIKIKPTLSSATRIIRAVIRKKFEDEPLLEKKGFWTKINDEIIYQWYSKHPEDFEKQEKEEKKKKQVPEISNAIAEKATVSTLDKNKATVEFKLDIEDLVNKIVEADPSKRAYALIYKFSEGIGTEKLRHKDIAEESEELLGEKITYETSKERKKRFMGLVSRELGSAFESWLKNTIDNGYTLKGILEDVTEVERFGNIGEPDLVCRHEDGSYTVISAKCLNSNRSETFERAEFNPEIRYDTELKNSGYESKILVIFQNIGIPHMLSYRVYKDGDDIPANITFSPSEAGKIFFEKEVIT